MKTIATNRKSIMGALLLPIAINASQSLAQTPKHTQSYSSFFKIDTTFSNYQTPIIDSLNSIKKKENNNKHENNETQKTGLINYLPGKISNEINQTLVIAKPQNNECTNLFRQSLLINIM